MDIRDLDFEVEKLESTEGVDSAQAATVTSHGDWLDITSVDVNLQKGLSNFLEGKTGKRKIVKAQEALERYHKQGEPRKSSHQNRPNPDLPDLQYRRIVHQRRQSQKRFLNSIPDRVQVKPILFVRVLIDLQSQEYGTKYWTAARDVGLVMESFANYLRYFEKQD